RVVGHLLDVHAAFGGGDERDAAGGAVDQAGEVKLPLDVGTVLDIDAVDHLPGRAGLLGDQGRAEHLADEGLDLLRRAGEADAALVAGLRLFEAALAAAAGMD